MSYSDEILCTCVFYSQQKNTRFTYHEGQPSIGVKLELLFPKSGNISNGLNHCHHDILSYTVQDHVLVAADSRCRHMDSREDQSVLYKDR
ncbi:hypothetical protein J6590_034470 [Homalodisca vitripennis]|nr:hypothetical protein J6590_034470 [Homalodisca vitripennis]